MKRIVLTAMVGVAVAIASAGAAAAGDGPARIGFASNYFDPQEPPAVSLRLQGPEAVWTRMGGMGDHNVQEDQGFFSSGPPASMQRYEEDISAGTWHYYCRIHGSVLGGMAGEVSVAPIAERAAGETVRVTWADERAQTGNRYEVEYRGDGAWKTWVKSTGRRALRFGAGFPVQAPGGETYRVRVRSHSSNDASRRSGWSPPVRFTVK